VVRSGPSSSDEEHESGAEDQYNKSEEDSDHSEVLFQEIAFKFEAVIERLNGLYNLATKIRNPTTRPQRSTADLYKRVPKAGRQAYIQEREMIETSVVIHMHKQYLMRAYEADVDGIQSHTPKANNNSWLIERIGRANARRSQQFVYWKEHAERIAKVPSRPGPPVHYVPVPVAVDVHNPVATTVVPSATPHTTQNYTRGPTTATRLDPEQVKLDDEVSMRSTNVSHVSSMRGFDGDKLNWPLPPKALEKDGFFSCPYCRTICPARYLAKEAWK
jgi:hypothetical protein